TSQCGQSVNDALVIDLSKHASRLIDLDAGSRTCAVEPGIVLDNLNALLKPHGLWFPVDVSTSSRATIGGMAGNNSCGARSIRYGTMRDNVRAIDAVLASGEALRFAPVPRDISAVNEDVAGRALFEEMLALGDREKGEIAARFPKLTRRVGGYNIDALVPNGETNNLAHLLVGSEGTLALFTRIELKLLPLPKSKVMGVCHFPTFRAAMEAAQHIVKFDPTAVELIDDTMIGLARDIALFRPTIERLVRGKPAALLMVEFAEEDKQENLRRLARLGELMGDLGLNWPEGGVIEAVEPELQAGLNEVRKAGLNIMMSMKSAGKPVSFVEDCAVPLADLADYTERLTAIFERHGTRGTWYAHASVGCLHVRPVLNLKLDTDVKAMRAIAEEAFEMVRGYKGSHSGEHGDGITRSEFHEKMFGPRLVRAFEEVKDAFDPEGLLNPGRIVRAPRMDDRSLMRYGPGYGAADFAPALDWSAWPGAAGGFQGAVEMCNNNGACRKLQVTAGVMCPSFRLTGDEKHVTRGRANALRLALSGQLGPDALTSDDMRDSLSLCVSCKACRRECPTGVDMARMKIEVAAARARTHGLSLRERIIAYLPRYAPFAAMLPWLMNAREFLPGAAWTSQRLLGLSARRKLPGWRWDVFVGNGSAAAEEADILLLADTFNRYYEPENLYAAQAVLTAAGYRVATAEPLDGGRPLCCGRTFLSAGLVEEARKEARRLIESCLPHVRRGAMIVGLEPSCLFTLRDEMTALKLGAEADEIADSALLFEEFLAGEADAGRLSLPLCRRGKKALLHGHCHQKAFGAMGAVETALRLVPGLEVSTIASGCCGMAGAFGYEAENFDISMAMGEADLLPAVRAAPADADIVADGTSCRQQIAAGSGRKAVHVARVLAQALDTKGE
ncbi:MAG: FAD-linked oxidase C-terminal domain-containing protein, partial [Hyphomicrobiales bacterium]|nr:FAD-linked oxidase C-terminal domain-containing protein [Hyphomicrobiales bacterium]